MTSTEKTTLPPVVGTRSGMARFTTSMIGAGGVAEPGGTNCTSAVALAETAEPSSAVPDAVTVSGK